jgi:hypothetical protein
MKKWTLALVAVASVTAGGASAQPASPGDTAALRQQVERRFEVVLLSGGVALVPRSAIPGVRSIELTDGLIAVDGAAVTGAELRERLGEDADAVLQLSYLPAAERRALFAPAPAAPAQPAPPEPPAATPGAAAPIPPPSPSVPDRPRRQNRRGDQVRIGGSVRVDEDELIAGDVVAIGGSSRVDGEVRGDVVAVGGNVELGPRAVVTRDVVVVGGILQRAEGSIVEGQVHEIGIGSLNLSDWRWGGAWPGGRPYPWFGRSMALMSTVSRVAVLSVLTALVILLGRDYVQRISLRAAAEPLKAGAVGLLAQMLFLPVLVITIVILVVTIIGIPLLLLIPFALLGLVLIALVGFTAVAYRIGQVVSGRFGWDPDNPYLATILGIVALVSPLLVARLIAFVGGPFAAIAVTLGVIAFIVEYVAWTVGFGAVALARFGRPPSPLPPVATAPPVIP